MKRLAVLFFAIFVTLVACAEPAPAPGTALADIAYKSGDNLTDYEKERCKLDLYLPADRPGFPTLLWFHGGGLTGGRKDEEFTAKIARFFAGKGIAVAAANYRLSPKTPFPGYVEDAAAAFAWLRAHIAEQGGDREKVLIGGHSAGAYLTAMLGMDVRYLKKFGLEPSVIAGLIPVSAQMMTHYTVRAERGIGRNTIIADEAAPIYFTRKETPPMLVIYADNDMPARQQENAYFVAAQKAADNERVTGLMVGDRTHGSIAGKIPEPDDPAGTAIVEFIETIAKQRGSK
ncbi:MAG TPA: alpha/beta hydrolase [Chthoniobacteraceae bacterium]|nr:alpha/beta hydrolase [Chthoniobacteraceae bacterium]